jgi:hypothetical protein
VLVFSDSFEIIFEMSINMAFAASSMSISHQSFKVFIEISCALCISKKDESNCVCEHK